MVANHAMSALDGDHNMLCLLPAAGNPMLRARAQLADVFDALCNIGVARSESTRVPVTSLAPTADIR